MVETTTSTGEGTTREDEESAGPLQEEVTACYFGAFDDQKCEVSTPAPSA